MRYWQVLVIVFGIIIIFHSWSLMRFPAPFVDEAWLISRSWAFIHTGRVFGPLDQGVFDRFEGYWTFYPYLPAWIYAVALLPAQEPLLMAARVVSLLFGIVLLVAVYHIGNKVGGNLVALVSILLVSTSWAFHYSAHLARYDIIASAMGYLAIAISINSKKRHWWVSLISGLLVGLAFEVHPNSIIFVPVLIVIYIHDFGWTFYRETHFLAGIGGIFCGLFFYAAMHVIPYPETYKYLINILFSTSHRPPIYTMDVVIISNALLETGLFLGYRYQLLIPIILISLVFLMVRKNFQAQKLFAIFISLLLSFALLIKNKLTYYGILIAPIIDITIATFLVDYIRRPLGRRLSVKLAWMYIWIAIISMIILYLLPLKQDHRVDYLYTQDRISQAIKPGDVIMASQTFWLGLNENTYYTWEQLPYYKLYSPSSSLEDAFEQFKPDIFVIDRQIDQYIKDQSESTLYLGLLNIPKKQLNKFLSDNANLIDNFDGGEYGIIRIYRISWGKEPYQQ